MSGRVTTEQARELRAAIIAENPHWLAKTIPANSVGVIDDLIDARAEIAILRDELESACERLRATQPSLDSYQERNRELQEIARHYITIDSLHDDRERLLTAAREERSEFEDAIYEACRDWAAWSAWVTRDGVPKPDDAPGWPQIKRSCEHVLALYDKARAR